MSALFVGSEKSPMRQGMVVPVGKERILSHGMAPPEELLIRRILEHLGVSTVVPRAHGPQIGSHVHP